MKERIKKFLGSGIRTQCIIFAGLFLLAELLLRLFGWHAGTLIDDFKVQAHPVYKARFVSDGSGINHILGADTTLLMRGTVINRQGFRGSFDYTPQAVDSLRRQGKKTVMLIGDSYVEGCCADMMRNSFGDLLSVNSGYQVLNFGVAGTDPLQYKLIAKEYSGLLRPDRVVIVIYFGNDVLSFKRTPTPGIPLTFPFENNKWLFDVAPNHLSGKMNYTFKSAGEAYAFYLDHYTLHGANRNAFEKAIACSVILSKIYLLAGHKIANWRWLRKNPGLREVDGMAMTHHIIKDIAAYLDAQAIRYLFVGIPEPADVKNGADLKKKYARVFGDLPWYVPENLLPEDYDGSSMANHFNNSGHKKYAVFLERLLKQTESAGTHLKHE
jgi:hypothetical protein